MLAARSAVGPAARGSPPISPSPCRKPSASSSSWPGVRIVTASAAPSTRISSGSSTATSSRAPSCSTTACAPCTRTDTAPTLARLAPDAPGQGRPGVVDTKAEYADLARLYLPIAIAVFAIVTLTLFAFLWRFRARRAGRRSERAEHDALEIGYIVVLTAIAAVLVAVTFSRESRVDAQARNPAVRVDVVGAKWDWRFAYPEQGIDVRDTLVVPAGRTIAFRGRSVDVIHDFWVPGVRFQHQVFPSHVESWKLVFPHPGRYQGLCAWFCGLGHQDMRFTVRALDPAAFDAWVAARR